MSEELMTQPKVEAAVELPQTLGLEAVISHDGDMPVVPRMGASILDLRRSAETADETSIKYIKRTLHRFHKPTPVRHDVLYRGEDLKLYRGIVFQDEKAVEGTFHHNTRGEIPAELTRLQHLVKKNKYTSIEGRHAFLQKPGSRNYFHWTIECLSRFALLEPLVEQGRLDGVVLTYDAVPEFVTDSIKLFFPKMLDRITVAPGPLVLVEDLHFFISGGVAAGQSSDTRMSTGTKAWIDSLPRAERPGDHIVFVARGSLGNRRLVNEDDLIAFLKAHMEVDVVVGHNLSVEEQRARFSTPKAIVGVHGAGLTNLIFAPKDCKLLEITSLQYINRTASFHDSCRLAGGVPMLVLGDQAGDRPVVEKNVGNDIVLDPDRFGEILDLLA